MTQSPHPDLHPPRLRTVPGRLIVLSGPSGVGKDTVLRELFAIAPDLHYSVSYTTRSPRPGERDGASYSFVDVPTFKRMAKNGEFLEWAEVHGNLYGTSLARVAESLGRGEDVILKIDVQGAARVRRRVEGVVTVFLLPPSGEELRKRLQQRSTEDTAELERRQHDAVGEMAEAEFYDFRVVNDDVHRAAREVLSIITQLRAAGTPVQPVGAP